jgi:tyrosine-specific transport protein
MQGISRLIGGILLVAGTATGAGMLALPVITSFGGFFPSLALLFFCWIFLFATSWLLLDVNLSFPWEVNLVTMASRTLGTPGRIVCWVAYLFLLYSLTAAYIAGSSPLFLQAVSFASGWSAPPWFGPIPLLLIFGFFVYLGTSSVDRINRLLMVFLIAAYFILTVSLPPHIEPSLLLHIDAKAIWVAVPVVFTSFGFHIIIPTLTTYLHHDVKKLRLTLLIGSFIPFLVYSVWEFLILGIVPIPDLSEAFLQGQTGAAPLSRILQADWIGTVASIFSFFAIITSFLGVSLSLSDFLSDGLKMKRFSFGQELSSLLTFLPPLFFVYTYPQGFIMALQYAGIFVVILLCLLPALMAWKLPAYRTPLKRLILSAILLISALAIVFDVLEQLGTLKTWIEPYLSQDN